MDQNSLSRTDRDITAIYDRQVETVYRVCFSMTGNRYDAEDAVQTVFVKLMGWSQTGEFNDYAHEKAWLITTARNVCRDLHRQWWRRKVSGLETLGEAEACQDDSCASHEVWEKLMSLEPKYRTLLYLYYYEEYKIHEISAMLGLNENTVKTRLRAARKKLKLEMGEDFV